MEYSLLAVFTVGLVSTLHCLGMCGGIVGALSLGLPGEVQQNRWREFPFVLAYNSGRIVSYVIAGALVGALGNRLFSTASPEYGHTVLQWLALILMFAMGLYLAGWLPRFSQLEEFGRPIWRKLEPLGKKLLPIKSPLHAFSLGIVWGWLPCGMVYSMLIYAAASGSAVHSAQFMLAFGLGTLPTMTMAGLVAGFLTRFRTVQNVRRGAGIVVMVLALLTVVIPLNEDRTQHVHGAQPQFLDH